MIRLFTSCYPEANPVRQAEFAECLQRNLACPRIEEIRVFVEGSVASLPVAEKLQTRQSSGRPTYDDFFHWINEVADVADVSVVANADIWFDQSIGVVERALGKRDCFAMARWDGDRLFDRNDSQDSWFFRGPIADVRGDFPVGVPRCDNRMLYELQTAGYHVRNPAFSLKARHLHSGQRDEYPEHGGHVYIPPPYRYMWPGNLWSLPRTWWHNLRHPEERIGWRFDRRGALATLPARIVSRIYKAAIFMTSSGRKDDV